MTDRGIFCYEVMLFDLNNVRATYQRLMDRIFKERIDCNVEVYVDDMIVKSESPEKHVRNLLEVFERLHDFNMRLYPKKCMFGVEGGKFMGFLLRDEKSRPIPTSVRP